MNKKNLSVVMAGAMLATSVAPVLADTTTVNDSNKGLMIKEFRELLESKTFANEVYNEGYVNKPVHYVKIAKTEVAKVDTLGDASDAYKNINTAIRTLHAELNSTNAWGTGFITLQQLSENETPGYLHIQASVNAKLNTPIVIGENDVIKVYVVVTDANGNNSWDRSDKATLVVEGKEIDDVETMEETIKKAPQGTKFEAWDRGHREENGKFYAYDTKVSTVEDFEKIVEDWKNNKTAYPAVLSMELKGKVLTVKVRQAKDETTHEVKTYTAGEDKLLNFKKAMSSDDKELTPDYNGWITKGFDHFADLDEDEADRLGIENVKYDIDETLVKDIEIDDAENVFNVKLSDLYDGLYLTDKGQELLDALKLYDSKELTDEAGAWEVLDLVGNNNNSNFDQTFEINDKANGLYTIEMEFTKPVPSYNGQKSLKNRVVITTNDKTQLEYFAKGLEQHDVRDSAGVNKEGVSRKFTVQVLKGSNRYETAVKVAKENADITTVAKNGNIVLVNGYSLVDGLAAAPLAASVQNLDDNNNKGVNYAAPVLLTEANGLPKETKEYMKEVIGEQQIKNLDKVTVYLVGGEGVISKAVENDLKEIGFRVVRAGGEDREETSLKVAELMYKDGRNSVNEEDAFVVGANGEADAMSIAPVAAATKTPIIVESVHGMKEDTVNFLKGYKNDTNTLEGKDVTIIGGEKAVSKATENMLKEEKLNVARVFGDNRKATNAKIIDYYYGAEGNTNGINPITYSFDTVVVSKDAMQVGREKDLIDALTATSLAVRDYAPIVLATDKLSEEQINSLNKNASRDGVYVYSIGNDAREVVKTIASRIGLAK